LLLGVLIDNLIKCPWHGASFDITTGACDIGPALNSLETYNIYMEDDKLFVDLPTNIKYNIEAKMSKRNKDDKRKYVIIGGGPAALSCAETLRQNNYTGELTLISEDEYLPYNRTSLTKEILASSDIKDILLRNKEFYDKYDIKFVSNSKVVVINEKETKLRLSNGVILVIIILINSTLFS